jgi:ubiquinone/menaquinone biosynthesis C-methylase UbiE
MSKFNLMKKDADTDDRLQQAAIFMSIEDVIARYYTHDDMSRTLMDAIHKSAHDPHNLSLSDLAPYDVLHIGGHPATMHLVEQLHLKPDMRVLDIGSGLGGPARYVATEYDVKVTGLDLTPEHRTIATLLSEQVGLIDEVRFDTGDARQMPYDNDSFDAAYTIHTSMNIQDKQALYREAFRVLKPGAMFGIYDVTAGPTGGDLLYPVPWAATSETSFLSSPQDILNMLSVAGFDTLRIESRREFALKMLKKTHMQNTGAIPDIVPVAARGADFAEKIENLIRNIEEDRCTPWQIICKK